MGSKAYTGKTARRASSTRPAVAAAPPRASPAKVTRATTTTIDWAAIVGHLCRAAVCLAIVLTWTPPNWVSFAILGSNLLPSDGLSRIARLASGR